MNKTKIRKIKKTVLIVTPFAKPNIGGAETLLEDYTEYIRKHGYYVYLQTYQPITTENVRGKPYEKVENMEIFRHSWPGYNLFFKLEKYPALNFFYLVPGLFLHSFFFMLRHHKEIEVIDAWGFSSTIIARLLKYIFKKKATMMVVSLYEFSRRPLYANLAYRVIKGMDHIVTESHKSKEEIAALGYPREMISPFNEWVDLKRFKPTDKNALKKKLGWEGKFMVLFVGRAIPIKGADILLKVAKKVSPKISFAFISGAGPQIELLQKEARENENIIFVGKIPYDQLHLYYQAADLFAIPSRYEENVARTMIEAIACGTPVVASNMGAIPQALDETVSVLIKPTAENFSREIQKLFDEPKRLAILRKNCWPYAKRHFSDKNAQAIADCYDK